MGHRWAILMPPLVCGLLAVLCFVLLGVRPPGSFEEYLLILALPVMTIAIATGWEFHRQQRQRGMVEQKAIRLKGTTYPALVVPLSPHFFTGLLLLCLLIVGLSSTLLIFESRQSTASAMQRSPLAIEFCFSLGILGTLLGIWWVLHGSRLHDLVLLPHGILLPFQSMGWFLPWEVIEEVSATRLPLVSGKGPMVMGIRVTEACRREASPTARQLMAAWEERYGWHSWVSTMGLTLTAGQVEQVARLYLHHPQERGSTGMQPGFVPLQSVLTSLGSGTSRGGNDGGSD